MDDMSPDLFHQGSSTGSGLFGDCHLDGLCDEPRVEPFSCESDGQFAAGDASMDFSGLAVDSIYIFDVETFHGHLDRAWHTLEPAASLKFPWETGIWCEIFGNTDRSSHVSSPALVRPGVVPLPDHEPVAQPAVKSRRVASKPQSWQQVVMASDFSTWQEIHEAKLDTALKRFFDVVIMFPTSYQLVSQLAALKTLGEQMNTMRDVLGSKSPLTLLKRVNSITRYTSFLRARGIGAPGVESDLYAFLNEQRDAGAPQSRLASVVEAVRFAEHVLGLEGVSGLLSKRCLGAARLPTAGPQKQASPLTVDELKALHSILLDEDDTLWDRNMAGAFLCCVYTRSRWSDFQHANTILADPDISMPEFVELTISDYKTKSANSWRGGLLAAVAPAVGVTSDNWAAAWLSLRETLGAPLEEGYPVMPAPDLSGVPTKRPISTKEVSGWIRLLLDRRGLAFGERRVSSHSAKATMLSFLSKFGADLAIREILGAHVSHLQSVIRYSRDALAEPLRVMCRMLNDIRIGRFVPDATRSGYFQEAEFAMPCNGEEAAVVISDDEVVKVELPEPVTFQEPDPEEELDTGSSSDEEAANEAKCSRAVTVPKAPPGFKLFQHSKSRMLHLMDVDHCRVFQCGRSAGAKHEIPPSGRLRWDTPCCGKCWRAAGHSVGSRLVNVKPDNKGAGSASDKSF